MNRTERRRREKEDEKSASRGLDVVAGSALQMASLMRVLHRKAEAAIQQGTLDKFFSVFFDNIAKSDLQAPRDIMACHKGCSHCCYMWVSATAPEALFLASIIKRQRVDKARLLEGLRATRDMDFEARSKFVAPCPLLSDSGNCSVYSSRPLACRTAASADSEICRRSYLLLSEEDIPTPMFFMLQRASYAVVLQGAFLKAGLRLITYELNEALAVALTVPNAEVRWLRGEDIFAGVRRDPDSDLMAQANNRQLYEYAFA